MYHLYGKNCLHTLLVCVKNVCIGPTHSCSLKDHNDYFTHSYWRYRSMRWFSNNISTNNSCMNYLFALEATIIAVKNDINIIIVDARQLWIKFGFDNLTVCCQTHKLPPYMQFKTLKPVFIAPGLMPWWWHTKRYLVNHWNIIISWLITPGSTWNDNSSYSYQRQRFTPLLRYSSIKS